MSIEAMKQALEALGKIEEHGNVPGWCEFDTNEDAVNYHEAFNKGMKASTALRAAIAEQEKAESLSMLSDGFIDEVDAPFIAACNPKTIKQLVELTRLMKRAIKIEHDDHCNCADHILEAIEAFNNFERNL